MKLLLKTKPQKSAELKIISESQTAADTGITKAPRTQLKAVSDSQATAGTGMTQASHTEVKISENKNSQRSRQTNITWYRNLLLSPICTKR